MPKTKLQFSSGGIIYRRKGKRAEVALIVRGEGKIFCLPKGKIEKPETPRQTALREVEEETGLKGKIEKEIGKINYWFHSKEEKARIFKTVYFYLIKYESGETTGHDFEVEEVKWLTVDEALKVMTYPSERKMMQKVKQILYPIGTVPKPKRRVSPI
ncbi:MAG: hypothetical protein AMJ78_08100 [Omnitrophica WOR_2 bacterium SM23_29]|nr:MAG: hypothetical protein AMJ78_08100 [Omnitrophica WOR_2 bacterium SM23_29]